MLHGRDLGAGHAQHDLGVFHRLRDRSTTHCQKHPQNGQSTEVPLITPVQALRDRLQPGNYFNRPDAGQLNTIFTAIAADISQGVSKLID